jgi:hypothetical protein
LVAVLFEFPTMVTVALGPPVQVIEFPTGALQVALATPVDTASASPTIPKETYALRFAILGPPPACWEEAHLA